MSPLAPLSIDADGAPASNGAWGAWRDLLSIVAVSALFGLFAAAGVWLGQGGGRITPVWLANGVMVAVLLARPRPRPGLYVLGAFVANLLVDWLLNDPPLRAVGLAAANAVEVWLVTRLMTKGREWPDFRRIGDFVRLAWVGGLVGPAASMAVAQLALHPARPAAAAELALAWMLSDGLGMLLLAPTLLILTDAMRHRRRLTAREWRDGLLIFALGAMTCVGVFFQSRFPLLFLMVPVVFVHAWRLGRVGTAVSIINISIIASIATSLGHGPIHLIQGGLSAKLYVLQLFLAVSAGLGLPVAIMLEAQRAIAAELQQARDLAASMLENMREVIFRADAEGRWLFLNPAWEALTGHRVDQSIGRRTIELLHPDSLAEAIDAYPLLIDGEVEQLSLRQRLRTAAGNWRTIELSVRALREDGRFAGTIGNIRDITDQVAIEQALAANRGRYELLSNLSPAGIVHCSANARLTYCNPAWQRMTGLTFEQAMGCGWKPAMHPDDQQRVDEDWIGAVKERRGYRTEFRFIRDDGVTWVACDAAPEFDENGELKGFVAVLLDISDRKQLEQELVSARRHAEAGAVAKSNFLANMSHEIRTPMNGVLGFAELLLDSDLVGEQRQFASLILDSGQAMMRLLNDILDISKVESGRLEFVIEPVAPRPLIDQCLKLMAPTARVKAVALEAEGLDLLPATIASDGHRIRQILLNLIGNAVKFTEAGSIRLVADYRAPGDGPVAEPGELRLSVHDTGTGIPPDQLEQIFQPFEQAYAAADRRYGGTGLGLTISRQLARGMGGELAVISRLGQGSIFTLTLPVALALAAGDAAVAALRVEPPAPPRAPSPIVDGLDTILLAEDVAINQLLVGALLERAGFRVELAVDGREAVERVERAWAAGRRYALLLMDMQMPRMGGLEATAAIRALGIDAAALPIVAITANAYADDIAACLAAGMQGHLAKPVARADLDRVIARWALGREAGATLAA